MSSDDLHLYVVPEDDDEPVSVAFHESPDDVEPESPPTPPPPSSSPPSTAPVPPPAAIAVVRPATSVSASSAVVTSFVLPTPLPTIKPVNINGGFPASVLSHALPDSPTAVPSAHTATPQPSPSHQNQKAVVPVTHVTASPSPYLYPPTPTGGLRVSAYAISLLTSGSIFRSYKMSARTGQVEFQDIKLYAMFPPSLTATLMHPASHSHIHTAAGTDSRAASYTGPSEPTLYWGPPNTKTSAPSPWHIPLTSITDIFKGKKSLLFHSSSPLVSLLSNSRCFTISSPAASLHLEAVTEQIREEWIARIVEIVRVVGGKHLEFSHTDEGEEEESRREKERRERLRHIQEIQASMSQLQKPPNSSSTASTDKEAEHSMSRRSGTLTPSASDSTLSLSSTSPFLWRYMAVDTKERTAREKLEISLDMRYTLRECVQSAARYVREHGTERVDPAEFSAVEKHSTTHLPTKEHLSANFEYKSYAGSIFTRLRWHFDITDASYLQSVAGESGYADFIANSKSGSFFFYTYDKAYMIKSMNKDESEFLRVHVLPSYYHHLMVYKDSLIIKIFGVYRIRKRSMSHPVYFMVMRNVFYTEKPIHLRFDLKGSTLGRKASDPEKKQETPVLKDLDFMEGTTLEGAWLAPTYLKLGMKKRAVLSQLEIDVKYLEQLNVMDYSLLVGIHDKDRERKAQEAAQQGKEERKGRRLRERQNNYGTRKDEVVIPRTVIREVQRKIQREGEIISGDKDAKDKDSKDKDKDKEARDKRPVDTHRSTRKFTPAEEVKTESPPVVDGELRQGEDETSHNSASSSLSAHEAPQLPQTPKKAELPLPSRPALLRVSSSTFFTQDDGGLCSVDPVTGREGNEIYYLGVIDVLQRYNVRKKMEHGVKALTHDAASVSCAPPHFYAERFLHSIRQRMLGVDESLVWVGAGHGQNHERRDSLSLQELQQMSRQSSEDF